MLNVNYQDSHCLASFPSVVPLDSNHVSVVENISTRLTFTKDEHVFQAGMPVNSVYVLVSGRIKLYRLSNLGRQVIQWFSYPGELFGLTDLNFTQQTTRSLYAQACETTEVLQVPKQAFVQLLTKDPELSMLVIQHLSSRLNLAGDLLLCMTSDNATHKVIKLILRLYERYASHDLNHQIIDVNLTHQELADMVGLCRQTMTTILSQLRKAQFIDFCGQKIIVCNADALHGMLTQS